MSDETTSKPKTAVAASTKAPARRTTPRGAPAKARVPEKPPVAAAPAPAAPAPKPARRAAAPKTTALKSAALKAAAAPRPEPVATEAAEIAPPADPAPAPVPAPAPAAARVPAEIPAPSLAPRSPAAASVSPAPTPVEDETPDPRGEAFSAVGIAHIPAAEELVKPYGRLLETGADGARTAYTQARESNEALAQACFESATAASRGMAALNAQVLDLMRANTDLTLSLMRSTLTAGSLSEAVKLQTSGARQAYETTSAHLRAIADTTTKLVGEATGPLTQAMTKR
ncbi:phasin family protein [Salinarimonas rosea]|uniref:phasin family protein n=1 Tax=Salinarimonas rosea TaxID=552063 RepID=UPI0004090B26|nr:phasin family protein [Salinarimonas rosea]